MIRLGLKKEPYWLDLPHGVRVEVQPMSTALMARVQARRAEADGAEDEDVSVAFVTAVAVEAIIAWEGVGDEKGKPAPVSPDYVAAMMGEYPIFRAFQTDYVATGLALVEEGNGSAPSPDGTTAGARNTAATAKRSARPARRGKTAR